MPPKKRRKKKSATVEEGSDIIFGKSAVVDPEDLLSGSIGTFPHRMTDKGIRVASKYDKYGPKEREIKDMHIKANERMFVKGDAYPFIFQSPKKGFGFGQALKPSEYNQQFGRKLFAGDEGTNLTPEDILRGQSNWNYNVMKLQGKKEKPEEGIERGPDLKITGVGVPTPNSWNRRGGKKKRRRRRRTKKKRRKGNLKKRTRRRRRKSKRRRRR
jgi:hypothetical protein